MSDIDVDKLKKAALSRRSAPSKEPPLWQCKFCKRALRNEKAFMDHECKEMKRHNYHKTVDGQAAYQYYSQWMKCLKRSVPSPDSFMNSRLYTAFIKFVERSKKIKLSSNDSDIFIKLMVERDLSPTLWARSQCYSVFVDFFDNCQKPMVQVTNSIMMLVDLCEKEDAKIENIFPYLGYRRIIELIVCRKLSPWYLFGSKMFGLYSKGLQDFERSAINDVIDLNVWVDKLEAHQNELQEISDFLDSMNL